MSEMHNERIFVFKLYVRHAIDSLESQFTFHVQFFRSIIHSPGAKGWIPRRAQIAMKLSSRQAAVPDAGILRLKQTGGWVAVKELKLSYYIGETLLFTIYTHYGN